jgi:outer membrane protein OmpA-like peptidoglycan-associated protein/tetratricopeptide (TPR) repeat protein
MQKVIFIGIVLALVAIDGNSQNLKELLDKGDKLFARQDYSNALKSYLAAAQIDPNDAKTNFRVGMSYLHSDRKALAVGYLEKAYQKEPSVDADIDYHLGMAYQNDHQYRKAIDHFFAFKKKNRKLAEIADHKIVECTIGDSLARNPVLVEIKNLGDNVNSRFHEYSPLVSPDGNTLIFTSNRSDNEEVIREGTNYEDIYVSRKNSSGNWGSAQKISTKINHQYNEAAASISHDGSTLFIYYEEGAGDIYTSKFENGEWTDPKPLGKNINHPHYWETSACISADGKKLYFTSNRPGGEGELDIYISELDSKGEWGKAVNLGPTVNTPFHEDSPFIHADGVTLYFSSDGHPSMGSNDLFKTTFTDGKWTTPQNLGYPINSIEYDGFLYVSEDKKSAYYSALREDGLGDADIYFVKFLDPPPPKPVEPVVAVTPPAEPKPEDYVDPLVQLHKDMKVVTVLKGKVIDEGTAAPLAAVITLVDNETQKVIARINSNSQTGDFELVIPHGGNYGVATEKSGYLFNSINFNLPQFAEYQEIDTHILMVKAEVGSKVVLKNIFFDVGKSELKQESLAELEKIKQLLLSNTQLKVQINGHTDNSGNAATNQVLSLKRAEAVVQYLIEHGIETPRLSAKGFGSEKPLVSNDDEAEGREINRRTEIEITEVGGSG